MQTSLPGTFPTTLREAAPKIMAAEGLGGFYKSLVPLWGRQIPYTMMKFACFEKTVVALYDYVVRRPKESCSKSEQLVVTFAAGYIAGVFCAIVSHPADTLLSKVNKKGAGGEGSMMTRLMRIAGETGFVNLCTVGLLPRCIMIGTLTAGQFGIFDTVMGALGASKFHFHNPNSDK